MIFAYSQENYFIFLFFRKGNVGGVQKLFLDNLFKFPANSLQVFLNVSVNFFDPPQTQKTVK